MKIYEEVTKQIVNRMEQCGTDWMPKWKGAQTMPKNFVTNHRYRGFNVIILWMSMMHNGYSRNQWASYKQFKYKTPGHIRKGEHGTAITFFDRYDRNANKPGADPEWRSVLKTSYVFNVDQVDGLDLPDEPVMPVGLEREQEMDEFIIGTGATIKTSPELQPAYNPALDLIKMPRAEDYTDPLFWYHDCFHELGHWTGHKDRLDRREHIKKFFSHAYAGEELVAELTASFTGAEFSLDPRAKDDSAQYLNSWMKSFKDNPGAFPTAARLAADATDYLFKRGAHETLSIDPSTQEVHEAAERLGNDQRRQETAAHSL